MSEPPYIMTSVYIHFPLCEVKCPYCAFVAGPEMGISTEQYVDALVDEIHLAFADSATTVATVFFGGGTPSLLSPADVERILSAVRETTDYRPREISLECNPGDVTAQKIDGFAAAGVTRVSLGVQSMRDEQLVILGRNHTQNSVNAALRSLIGHSLPSWSADLIYAIPGQTVASWRAEIQEILAFQPPHISTYALTLGGGKRLARDVPPVDADLEADLFLAGHEELTRAGYTHYEVSNYAQPGHESAHNIAYWTGGAYRGVGVGAHSYTPAADAGEARWAPGATRFWNFSAAPTWCERIAAGRLPIAHSETIDAAGALTEGLGVGLRYARGSAIADLMSARFLSEGVVHAMIAELIDEGLVDAGPWAAGRVSLTPRGWLVTDEIAARLATCVGEEANLVDRRRRPAV